MSAVCTVLVAELLYLDSSSQKDITMYVNSPGGSVTAGKWLLLSTVSWLLSLELSPVLLAFVFLLILMQTKRLASARATSTSSQWLSMLLSIQTTFVVQRAFRPPQCFGVFAHQCQLAVTQGPQGICSH